ncbi:MAG: hypothetical protein AAGU74_14890 [Bacillota bacterium]
MKMRTIEKSIKNQKSATKFWWVFLLISLLLIGTAFLPEEIGLGEAAFGLAFIGIVTAVISIAMLRVYKNRKGLLESLADRESLLDVWECPDRYHNNKGQPVPAHFSKTGFFYLGKPYCLKSYECIIKKAEIIDDAGPALSFHYTVPSSRAGAVRHKSVENIPIPEGKTDAAISLAAYYTEAGSKNK